MGEWKTGEVILRGTLLQLRWKSVVMQFELDIAAAAGVRVACGSVPMLVEHLQLREVERELC